MRIVRTEFPAAPSRPYEIVIGRDALEDLGRRAADLFPRSSRRAFLIADEGLPASLVKRATASLASAGFSLVVEHVRAVEAEKTLDTAWRLLSRLASTRHERGDPVIALGGGITGDLAGFVAAVYRRGVPVIQCPTTLLSMVDASVGGKTGVNLHARADAPHTPGMSESSSESRDQARLLKNFVGSFHQPALVLADTAALDSLPGRCLRAGLAECIKHGVIGGAVDPGLFDWTAARLTAILTRDAGMLAELVERNVRVKASFVAGDEREEKPSHEGGRALLNLGHTFAHAIEPIPHLSPSTNPADAPLHHGEAVSLGIVAACAASVSMGRLNPHEAERVRRALSDAGLPVRVAGLPTDEELLSAMAHDKKAAAGRMRLILPVSIGRAVVVEDPPARALREGIASIRT